MTSTLLPALGIRSVKVMGSSVGDGRAAAAEAEELAAATFLELLILAELFHLRPGPKIIKQGFTDITNDAVEPPAGHHIAIGADGEMAVPAVAAVVNQIVRKPLRNLEQAVLIQIQRPKMVLQVEIGSGVLVLLVFLPALVQHIPVLKRRQGHRLLLRCGAISAKGKDIGLVGNYGVDNLLHLTCIDGRYRGHSGHLDTRLVQDGDFFQRAVVGARFSHPVVRLTVPVYGELVLLAAIIFQLSTNLVRQMERITQDGERNLPFLEHPQNLPNLRMQHRVPAGDIEIRHALLHPGAHVHTIVDNPTGIRQTHGNELGMPLGKDVTVFASLVAVISDVPLECEVL